MASQSTRSSTARDVARALCDCFPLVEKWEGLGAFKTKDQKRFLALMKMCAEMLLEKDKVRDEWSSKLVRDTREVWVVQEMDSKTRRRIVRGNVLLWLTEAHGLIEDGWHAMKQYFDPLWTHVQLFCGHEAVQQAQAGVLHAGGGGVSEQHARMPAMAEMRTLVGRLEALG